MWFQVLSETQIIASYMEQPTGSFFRHQQSEHPTELTSPVGTGD